MFNSIGVIGLLVLVGVLLTTATAPANPWPDASDLPDAGLTPGHYPGRHARH